MHRRGAAAASKCIVRVLPNWPLRKFGACRLQPEAGAALGTSACAVESWRRSVIRRTVERTLRSSRQHISFPRANAVAETRFSLGFPQSPNQPEDYRKTLWPDLSELKLSAASTTEMGKNFPQTNILIPRDGSQLPSYVWLIVSKPVEAGQQDNVLLPQYRARLETGCALTMDGHGYGAAPMAKKLRKTSIATAEKKVDGAA